jgi:hypothetical protein
MRETETETQSSEREMKSFRERDQELLQVSGPIKIKKTQKQNSNPLLKCKNTK